MSINCYKRKEGSSLWFECYPRWISSNFQFCWSSFSHVITPLFLHFPLFPLIFEIWSFQARRECLKFLPFPSPFMALHKAECVLLLFFCNFISRSLFFPPSRFQIPLPDTHKDGYGEHVRIKLVYSVPFFASHLFLLFFRKMVSLSLSLFWVAWDIKQPFV